jgi:hypothetical protein
VSDETETLLIRVPCKVEHHFALVFEAEKGRVLYNCCSFPSFFVSESLK